MEDDRTAPLRVGVIGHGAIGARVAGALAAGEVPGAVLAGVLVRGCRPVPARVRDLAALTAAADLVVEAAGQDALREHGPAVLAAGRDLLAVSVGALADDDLAKALDHAGPGTLLLSQGALGGLDVVRAAARSGPLANVTLTSTKRSASLVQPWMDAGLAGRLTDATPGDAPVTVFDGPAREAAVRFPRNANVAATLALAAGDWDRVRVRLVADPGTPLTRHVVEFAAPAGAYRFDLGNLPDPDNPATSGLVGHAVLRAVADRVPASGWRFV
ncbi:aspartate dehydrogenase domain-containing protein [Actinomadura atramentaria]|uniref:aspartate dehydrogenase domain-containing protein n=1 Tax=Actinomadura atramentaria TaxID=1990 RepID=UPI0003709694|nr:aspartate dehydrogenase domain-containing protein [Actinomadura atramentaria]